jgi:4-amino-4-deoxy-L-arabinose transferase-like glycosyltransferase
MPTLPVKTILPRNDDLPNSAVFITLLTIVLGGLWIRLQYWVLYGGFSHDYVSWAMLNYFGGLSIWYIDMGAKLSHALFKELASNYPPGYPAFIALVNFLGNTNPQSVRIVQLGIDSLACLLMYSCVRGMSGSRFASIVGAAIYALAPWWALGSTFILAEALIPATVLLILVLAIRARRKQRLRDWGCLGFLAALAATFRQELLPLLVAIVVWAILVSRPGERLRAVAASALCFAAPWCLIGLFNLHYHGQFRLTGQALYYALYSGLGQLPNSFGYQISDQLAAEELQKLGMSFHTKEAEEYWKHLYWQAWSEHPAYVVRTILERFRIVAFQTIYPYAGPFGAWSKNVGVGLLFSVIGSIVLLVRRRYSDLLLVWAPLAVAMATLGFIYVEPRYVQYGLLTYVLGGAFVFEAVLIVVVQLTNKVDFLGSRIMATVLLAALGGLVVWVTRHDLASLQAQARSEAVKASGIASALSESDFKPVENWKDGGAAAKLDSRGGVLRITSGEPGYQAVSRVETKGFDVLTYRYKLRAEQDSAFLGVLTGDGSQFLTQEKIMPGETAPRESTVEIHDSAISFVVSRGPKGGGTMAVSLRRALWCFGPTGKIATNPFLRLRYELLREPTDIVRKQCAATRSGAEKHG